MSSQTNPQHEPTMEEILASIRKIISEDQPEAAASQASNANEQEAQQEPRTPEFLRPEPENVLELTQEIQDQAPQPLLMPAQAVPEQKPRADDIAFATVDTLKVARTKEEPKSMDDNDLISESAGRSVGDALASLESAPGRPQIPGVSGNLEGLFTHAVQATFQPVLHQWIDSHNEQILVSLRPMIREWMDQNLPELVENAVKREIGRRARK